MCPICRTCVDKHGCQQRVQALLVVIVGVRNGCSDTAGCEGGKLSDRRHRQHQGDVACHATSGHSPAANGRTPAPWPLGIHAPASRTGTSLPTSGLRMTEPTCGVHEVKISQRCDQHIGWRMLSWGAGQHLSQAGQAACNSTQYHLARTSFSAVLAAEATLG